MDAAHPGEPGLIPGPVSTRSGIIVQQSLWTCPYFVLYDKLFTDPLRLKDNNVKEKKKTLETDDKMSQEIPKAFPVRDGSQLLFCEGIPWKVTKFAISFLPR